jgi:hypothetical protein
LGKEKDDAKKSVTTKTKDTWGMAATAAVTA